jgi:hypothetical protein
MQEVRLLHNSIHSNLKGVQNEMGLVKATVN